LGELALSAKRYPDAQRAFEKALSLNEKWAIPYRNLASTHLGQKKESEALAVMREGIQKTGGSSLLLTALATYLESVGKLDDAIAEYEGALKSQPKSPLATNNLAMLLAEYKSDPESLKRAQELAVALANSNEPAFLDTAGWVAYKNKNYQKAAELLEKAVVSASDAALIRFHLGMAYLALGNQVLAKDNLKQALDSEAEFRGKDIAKAEFAKL
jgi:Tfp pilus assembly protein PilF